MRWVLVPLPLAWLLGVAVGCGAEDDPVGGGSAGNGGSGGSVGSGGSGGSVGSGGSGASGAAGSAGTSNAGSSNGGSASGASGAAGRAGTSSGGSSNAGCSNGGSASGGMPSEACQKYCTCHDMNCPTQAIPGGVSCEDFCAAMSEDQLACRQNMCGLVPAQPDNDHCKHSVGIDQCL